MGEINLISHLKNRLKKLKPLRTTTYAAAEEWRGAANHQILLGQEEEERSAGFGSSHPHAGTHHLTSEQYWRVSLGLGRESLRRAQPQPAAH
jgi:hypothetical protein